jgi:hypothetical protein
MIVSTSKVLEVTKVSPVSSANKGDNMILEAFECLGERQ